MKKMVVKLNLHEDRGKKKALRVLSSLSGIDSVAMKDCEMTVIGNLDPAVVVGKLRKSGWTVEILTVGPAKEEKISIVPIDPISYNPYYPPYYYRLPPAEETVGCVIS